MLAFFACFLLILVNLQGPCAAFENPITTSPQNFIKGSPEAWTLSAESIEYDRNKDQYIASGNVRLQSGEKLILADYARFDRLKGLVYLKGNVFLKYGKDWIRGDSVTWNLNTESGHVEEGMAYFSKSNFYVQASHLEKKENNLYYLKNGFITTCSPQNPDWKISFNSLEVPSQGFATGRGLAFRIGSVPIIYIPWGTFPVREQRQSGFLSPVAGVSELQGFELEIPYFWAIDRSHDLTLFGHYLQKRGLMGGAEYRWSSLKWGEGIFIAHYLRDEADREHLQKQNVPFETKDRYWLRGLASLSFPYEMEGRLKLDMVSDKNFLKEFEKGSPSYDYTDKAFRNFLGTGLLDDKTITARESNLYMMKLWQDSELTMDTHYWDEENDLFKDTTLHLLPALSYLQAPTLMDKIATYYNIDSSLTHFWREKGSRGIRMRISPELSHPLDLASIFRVTPSFKLDVAGYALTEAEGETESTEYRAVPSVALIGVSELNKTYSLNIGNITSVKHTLRPTLEYLYVPDISQKDIPEFDLLDVVHRKNLFRYGLSSIATVKKEQQISTVDTKVTSYEEWLRINLFQYYAFGEQYLQFKENLFDTDNEMEKDKGFSDLFIELDLTPHRYIELSYYTSISPDEDLFTRHDVMLSVNMPMGQTIGIDYRYREGSTTDEVISSFNWNVVPWLTISMYHDYSLDREEVLKQTYGITYRRNCWSVSLSYEKEGKDRRFFVGLNLLGLGQTSLGYTSHSGAGVNE